MTVALLAGRSPTERYSIHRGYADSVWAVGATPVTLVPPTRADALDRYLDAVKGCDAVCVTGGGDIEPWRYREAPVAPLMEVDGRRDEAEVAAVVAAAGIGQPVLGICRGIQVMVVAFGGTLRQDLPSEGLPGHWDEVHQDQPVHPVTALPGTRAQQALGGATAVNSIHHQAVRRPGPRLEATAWGADGVIEAVEAPGMLGLQWHPERLGESERGHLAPFEWLVSSAADFRAARAHQQTIHTPAILQSTTGNEDILR